MKIATVHFTWQAEDGRPDSEKTLDTFLREASAAGCDGVESSADGLHEHAGEFGLEVCGAYIGGPFHLPWDELGVQTIALAPALHASELGAQYLAVNCDPKGSWGDRQRKTEDDLKRQGENLTRLAAAVEPLGLSVVLHNHANTNPLHLDDLRSATDYADDSVGICLDTGWSLTSLDDPVARATALGSRIRALHLRNQHGEVPTEWLGEGDLDLAAFLAVLKQNGYDGWFTTELWHRADVARTTTLVENQRRSNELLRRLWDGDGQ